MLQCNRKICIAARISSEEDVGDELHARICQGQKEVSQQHIAGGPTTPKSGSLMDEEEQDYYRESENGEDCFMVDLEQPSVGHVLRRCARQQTASQNDAGRRKKPDLQQLGVGDRR